MKIKIDAKAVEKEVEEARRRLLVSGLPQILAEIDDGAFGTTSLNLEILDALVQTIASTRAALAEDTQDAAPPVWIGFYLACDAADRLAPLGECPAPAPDAALPAKE